mmetsp:Transcript_8127/g.20814  ORF Transcript_8127/g.20814 Transcript_8127/m.20814 type:complete len:685 (+) Transcript_8127:263-2317(+)
MGSATNCEWVPTPPPRHQPHERHPNATSATVISYHAHHDPLLSDGRRGSVIEHHPVLNSYTVKLDDDETIRVHPVHLRTVNTSEIDGESMVAQRVEVQGLRNQFDGRQGVVAEFNPAFGSYAVRLDGDGKRLKVQAVNLRRVHTASTATSPFPMPSNATAVFSPAPLPQPKFTARSGDTKLSIDDRDVNARYEAMAVTTEASIAALKSTIAELEARLANSAAVDHDLEAKLSAYVDLKLKGSAEADLESGAMVPLSPLTGGTSAFVSHAGADKGGGSCEDNTEADSVSACASSALTCFGVVCFKISEAKSKVERIVWALCGLGAVAIELLAIMSVIALSAAPRCEVNDDCPQGEVCAFTKYESGQHAVLDYCLDCDAVLDYEKYRHLYEEGDFTTSEGFMFHPSGEHIFFEVPSSGNETLVESCMAQLEDAYGYDDFGQCLWWQMNMDKMTWATFVVFFVTVYMIIAALMTERQSQLFDMHARTALLGNLCGKHRSSYATELSIIVFTELLLNKVLITSVMCSAMWLMMTTGMGPADILLNGAALTFILTLDEEVVNLLVSEERRNVMLATLEAGLIREGTLSGKEATVRGQARAMCACVTFFAYMKIIERGSCTEVSLSITYVSLLSIMVSSVIEDIAAEVQARSEGGGIRGCGPKVKQMAESLVSSAAGGLVFYVTFSAFLH